MGFIIFFVGFIGSGVIFFVRFLSLIFNLWVLFFHLWVLFFHLWVLFFHLWVLFFNLWVLFSYKKSV